MGEVTEENDSFSCSVWVCEPMDLKSHRSTERYSGRRNCTDEFVNFRSITFRSFTFTCLYLAVSVRIWYQNRNMTFQSWLYFCHFIWLTNTVTSRLSSGLTSLWCRCQEMAEIFSSELICLSI